MTAAQKSQRSKRKATPTFNIDCTLPVENGIIKVDDLEIFFASKIKGEGKLNNMIR